jgi:hypothetical protein
VGLGIEDESRTALDVNANIAIKNSIEWRDKVAYSSASFIITSEVKTAYLFQESPPKLHAIRAGVAKNAR